MRSCPSLAPAPQAPPIVVGSDDEEWGDPEATGGYESGGGGGSGSEDEDELEGLRICG